MAANNTTVASLSPKKRGCLFAFLIACVTLIIGIIAVCIATDDSPKTNTQYIGGLNPVDVYLNLKERGFSVDTDYDVTNGTMWTCKYNAKGLDFTVTIFSPHDVDKAQSVRLNIMADPYANLNAGKEIAAFVATIPYDSADRDKARQFVEDNYNKDKASIVIGDACFTMYAPSALVRMLDIQKFIPSEEVAN
jgi:hypothetical protein